MVFETYFFNFGKKLIFHVFLWLTILVSLLVSHSPFPIFSKVARLEQNSTPQRRSHPWSNSRWPGAGSVEIRQKRANGQSCPRCETPSYQQIVGPYFKNGTLLFCAPLPPKLNKKNYSAQISFHSYYVWSFVYVVIILSPLVEISYYYLQNSKSFLELNFVLLRQRILLMLTQIGQLLLSVILMEIQLQMMNN